MRSIGLIVSLVFMATFALADIKGRDDPGFAKALDLWLQADDHAALLHFSALAKTDNRAAQMFLGILDTALWTHGHITAEMPRKDRAALLRAPGGLSGQSWLYVAAKDTPLATIYVASRAPVPATETAHALFDAGDLTGGFLLMTKTLNHGNFDSAFELALRPDALALTRGMFDVFQTEIAASENPAAIRAAIDALPPVSAAQRAIWPLDRPDAWADPVQNAVILKERGHALATHPLTTPLAQLLHDSCGLDPAVELAVLQGYYRNYPVALLVRSPVEPLLSTESYQASPRFAADVSRKILAGGMKPERLTALLPCTTHLEK